MKKLYFSCRLIILNAENSGFECFTKVNVSKKYDYYNIANIARLLTELPDDDLKEVMFIIEYKRKRLEEKSKTNQ